tara:strand:- start:1103 stop:1567 length:465 start_codon:yes stop_codon:yes gene_type:complete
MYSSSKIINKLIKKNISISVAESCSGGLISNTLVKHDGVSKIFSLGLVCYSNFSKIKYLSVSKKTLKKFGAVSSYVAEEMINNLHKKEKTKITVSTTGIAGPRGGTKTKPVGLVYIGIKFNNNNMIFKKIFSGNRLEIQRKTKNFVFKKIQDLI